MARNVLALICDMLLSGWVTMYCAWTKGAGQAQSINSAIARKALKEFLRIESVQQGLLTQVAGKRLSRE